jgi:hemolysin activation/secretion protein
LQPVLDGRPLDQAAIERALLLANELPGVEATSVLRPSGEEQGASDLVISVRERPVSGGADVSNRGSKSNGPWVAAASIAGNNIFDEGGSLGLDAGYSFVGEKYGVGGRYTLPFSNGLKTLAYASAFRGEPGAQFRSLEIVTESLVTGFRASYPIYRTRAETLSVEGGFTFQEADVKAIDQPVSHDSWRVLDVQVVWSQNGWLGGNTGFNVGVSQGLPILNASTEVNDERSRSDGHAVFTKMTVGARRLQALVEPISLLVAGTAQRAAQGLLAGEEISFGGNPYSEFGRGYDPAAITGDQGFGGTVELRWDERFGEPLFEALEAAQLYAFVDGGRVFNKADTSGAPSSIASTGLGVRTVLFEDVSAGIELARTLIAVPGSDNGERTTKLLFNAAFRF